MQTNSTVDVFLKPTKSKHFTGAKHTRRIAAVTKGDARIEPN